MVAILNAFREFYDLHINFASHCTTWNFAISPILKMAGNFIRGRGIYATCKSYLSDLRKKREILIIRNIPRQDTNALDFHQRFRFSPTLFPQQAGVMSEQLLRNISEAVSRAVVDAFAANSSQSQVCLQSQLEFICIHVLANKIS